MTRWWLETTAEFDRAARKLDPQALRGIKAYRDEVLALDDPRDRGRGLTADLAGCWRYRVGDYRVLVEIKDDVMTIIAIGPGHRSEIYQQ